MPRMPERNIHLTDLVLPYCKNGKVVDAAPQYIVDAWKKLKEWSDMQDQ